MSTLTEEVMTTVESTAPILQEHGLAITSHFYDNLFEKHPEAVSYTHLTLPTTPYV